MVLQAGDGPHLRDGAFYYLLHGSSLVVAIAENHHLVGTHHGGYTHGEGELGHLVDVVVEEAGVGNDGVGGEGLETSA